MRDHECEPDKCTFIEDTLTEQKGSEVINYIIKDITCILKTCRSRRNISENDLDKSICWLHDMSDIVTLHEVIVNNKSNEFI